MIKQAFLVTKSVSGKPESGNGIGDARRVEFRCIEDQQLI